MSEQLLTVITMAIATYVGFISKFERMQNPTSHKLGANFSVIFKNSLHEGRFGAIFNFICVISIVTALTVALAPELLSDSGKTFVQIHNFKLAMISCTMTGLIVSGQHIKNLA